MVLPAAWKISIEPVLVELFPEIAEDQPLKPQQFVLPIAVLAL